MHVEWAKGYPYSFVANITQSKNQIPCECGKVYIGKREGTCMNRLRGTIGIP